MNTPTALRAAATGQLAAVTRDNPLQDLLHRPFSPDAWHVMQERDNALIRDEVMHGIASKAFVYEFDIKGSKVTGVSVVGARELASQYKGIKQRIVATVEKRGSLFIFRTFSPLNIETRLLPELGDEDDFYESIMEVSDIKSGNSVEVRKKETKLERKRDGSFYERPHYDVIADSKAFRNGVLSLLPQSVIQDFKKRCLSAGNASAEQTIDQRRSAAAAHAAKHGIALDRKALGELSFAELDGLGTAAGQGLDAFKRSVAALGLAGEVDQGTGEIRTVDDKGGGSSDASTTKTAKKTAGGKGKPAANDQGAPPQATYAQLVDSIQKAKDRDAAALELDAARHLPNDQYDELVAAFNKQWSQE